MGNSEEDFFNHPEAEADSDEPVIPLSELNLPVGIWRIDNRRGFPVLSQ